MSACVDTDERRLPSSLGKALRQSSAAGALWLSSLLWASPASATGARGLDYLLIPLAVDVGLETYDVAAALRREKLALVFGLQSLIALPQAFIAHDQTVQTSSAGGEATLTPVLLASALDHLVVMGAVGAFARRSFLLPAYGLSWGAGLNLALTDAAWRADDGFGEALGWLAVVNGAAQSLALGTLVATGALSTDRPEVLVPAAVNGLWAVGLGVRGALAVGRARERRTRPPGVDPHPPPTPLEPPPGPAEWAPALQPTAHGGLQVVVHIAF